MLMWSDIYEEPSIGELTRSPETEVELEWKIPDFDSLMNRDEKYFSPTFSFAGRIWIIIVNNRINSLGVGVFRQATIEQITLEVSVRFKILNGKKDEKRCTAHGTDGDLEWYRISKHLERTELLKRKSYLLPSNVLTVLCTLKLQNVAKDAGYNAVSICSDCQILVDDENIKFNVQCVNRPINCPKCSVVVALKNWDEHECQTARTKGEQNKVLHDLKKLFLKKENCDVVLKVQGQEFQAHKPILQARSPVFASTFRNDMEEKTTGIIDIEDCDPSFFSDFLCFIYCGDKGVISEENVFSIFFAADKYDVADLSAPCLDFMKENLSVENFCDTMTVAVRHSQADLIKLTTDFFVKNATEIIKTVKWQSFLDENPTAGNELFLKFASSSSDSSK